jgi:Mg-chelatase subunit ChlI
LRLEFLGTQPFSIKPEMLFEGQVSIMFVDQIPLIPDYLEDSLLQINFTALLRNGTYVELPHIEIKPVIDGEIFD